MSVNHILKLKLQDFPCRCPHDASMDHRLDRMIWSCMYFIRCIPAHEFNLSPESSGVIDFWDSCSFFQHRSRYSIYSRVPYSFHGFVGIVVKLGSDRARESERERKLTLGPPKWAPGRSRPREAPWISGLDPPQVPPRLDHFG